MKQFSRNAVLIHIGGWLVFLSLPLAFNHEQTGNQLFSMLTSPSYLVFCLTYMCCFYVTLYYFIPKLYFKKRYTFYCASIALLLTAVFFIKPFDKVMFQSRHMGKRPGQHFRKIKHFPVHDPFHTDITSVYLLFTAVGIAMAIKIGDQLKKSEQRAVRAEADKATAELSFLKAQISPHFLFNTLNNIYTLAVTKNERTADSVLKLSEILRYLTEDAGKEQVSLEEEVKCITNYIELQRLRLGKNFLINFIVAGELTGRSISPLILLTFIENAFKYGVSKHDSHPITVKLQVDANEIKFYAENKIFEEQNIMERNGIGIENTRKRLDHMYGSNYVLDIKTEDDLFSVILLIQT
ncbi:MAG: putative signal transduction histidine kinase [Daejeonella sp.]|nr:putative signal transduction histidine kinase [Daejeonella sp.]